MLERHLLRYFLAVVDTGAFSRAATVCRVSQPTVSSGIARLEEVTGQILFKRSNRRVELTAAGARLVPHARRIEAEFLEAQRSLADVPSLRLVRIGVASTVSPAMMEAALQPFAWSNDLSGHSRCSDDTGTRGRICRRPDQTDGYCQLARERN